MIKHATPNTARAPSPNDLIESITGRRRLSWSQLNSYRGCPRRWFYSHVEGLAPDFISGALILGSAFHTAVQHHYEQRLEGLETTADTLKQRFRSAWDEEAGDVPIRFGKTENADAVMNTGLRMIDAFHTSDLAVIPGNGDLIAIEETFAGPIHPDMPDLVARIDVMWQTEAGLHLLDLKTSKSRWSITKARESADQLLLYQRMASNLITDQTLQLHFGVVSKAKKPSVELLTLPDDASGRIDDVVSMMLPVWNAMKAGVDFTSPSPMSCATCGYQSRCPAYRG